MLSAVEIDKAVGRVKTSMEIEGFTLTEKEVERLRKIASGKTTVDIEVEKYKKSLLKKLGK